MFEDVEQYFDFEEDSIEGEIIEEEQDTPQGVCSKCLNSGFVYTRQNGVIGLVYSIVGQDSAGRNIKRLQVCGHNTRTTY